MSVNLNKNKESLTTAWKDVLDDKTSTNWALFGYDGQTNDLKVVGIGSGGIEELTDDLNSGKIMYAFVKVNDPKTSLDKCVLINWQGEGANTVRKGICANHLRDIERFFCGAHLTVNARNEEEVEPQLIIDKIAKSGSLYSFKSARSPNIEPSGPIGTNYQRVNPIKEINSKARDQFWKKEEEEEKKRVEEERKRRESEKIKLEQEAKDREEKESNARDLQNSIRDNNIEQIKQADRIQTEMNHHHHNNNGRYKEDDAVQKVNESEVLRNQRKQEAQELISQRTIDARSIFEKNTSAGQIKKTPEKPVRNSILKNKIVQEEEVRADVDEAPVDEEDDEGDQFSTIKRSPRDNDKKSASTPTAEEPSNGDNQPREIIQQITEQQFVDEYIYGLSTPGLQARALYDYQAADDTEISFDPGDIITNIDQVDEGWWQGLAPDGITYGLFPANYVELIQ